MGISYYGLPKDFTLYEYCNAKFIWSIVIMIIGYHIPGTCSFLQMRLLCGAINAKEAHMIQPLWLSLLQWQNQLKKQFGFVDFFILWSFLLGCVRS